MGNVLVENNTLKNIADSIRIKNHSGDRYKPGDMSGAIRQIPSSGSGADQSLPVRFYDYDGTLLYSYTIEQIQNMEELPTPPEHDGLIAQGWNWTLEDLIEENGPMTVGAHYITDDGATRMYINLDTHVHSLTVKFGQDMPNGVKIDWGDGSPLETSTVVFINEYTYVTARHEYENPGRYVISLIPDEETVLTIKGSSFYGAYLVTGEEITKDGNRLYFSFVEKIEIGQNVMLGESAFHMMNYLKSITIPQLQIMSGQDLFAYCSELRFVTLSKGSQMDDYCLSYCSNLDALSIPNTVEQIKAFGLGNCESIEELNLPSSVKMLGNSCFQSCAALRKVTSNGGVDSIGYSCFSNASNLKEADILGSEITKIENSVFNGCASLRKMVIPSTVTEIGSSAFYIMYCLTDMYLYCDTPPTLPSYSIDMVSKSFMLHVKKGTAAAYQGDSVWGKFKNIIEMDD